MKITVINGQDHKGSTYKIGNMLLDHLGENDVTEFFLPRDLEHFCSGCLNCIKDEAKCPYYEEKKKITDSIEEADLLIFTTPTYCLRASAPMKSFIDLTFINWMSHRPRKSMFGKKAVVISTAAGANPKTAIKDITDMLFYWGVPYVKRYGVAIRANSIDEADPKLKAKVDRDMRKLADTVRNSKVRVGLKMRGLFMIMRLMQLKGMGAGEEDRSYWEKQGWLGSERPWK